MSGIEDDYGAYDPVQHENQLVAVYEDSARAQAARSALLAAGIPAAAIEIADQPGAPTTTAPEDEGFWASIKRLFVPDDDANAYRHAIHRGHAMLVVTAQPGMDRNRAIEEIERTDPLDFDARLQEWNTAGYDYSGRPSAGTMGGTTAGTQPVTGMAETTPRFGETVDESGATLSRPNLAEPGLGQSDPARATRENLRADRRDAAAGATRVRSYLMERPAEDQLRVREERADRPATPERPVADEQELALTRQAAENNGDAQGNANRPTTPRH